MMREITILATVILMVASCSPARHITTTTDTDTKIIIHERTEFVPRIIDINIPAVSHERETLDTMSVLETDFAKSVAIVRPGCRLYHSIEDKEQTIHKELDIPVIYKDSLVYQEKVVTEYIEVPTPAPLNWWQRVRLDGFYILAGILLLFIIGFILRLYLRK